MHNKTMVENYRIIYNYYYNIAKNKLPTHEDAEDLVQQAVLSYLEHSQRRNISSPIAYIYKTLNNLISSYYSNPIGQKEKTTLYIDETTGETDPRPEAYIRTKIIFEKVAHMTETEQAVFHNAINGLSFRQMERMAGKRCYERYSRMMKNIRKEITDA